MSELVPSVLLRPKRAQPFYARHPWVFAGAIDRVQGTPADGDEVDLRSSTGDWIARGLFNSQSQIRVRLYSWTIGEAIGRDLFVDRLRTALRHREDLGLRGWQKGCRLAFSEADGLSGMTIDEYSGWVTVQFTALGLANRKEQIADAIDEVIRPRGIYIRTEKGVALLEGLSLQDGLLRGELPPPDLTINENGLHFYVNLSEGQKTGFYHDQRDNRLAVAKLAKGRTVLDGFSYTGGFGIHALHAGATSVECVDVSGPAGAMALRNCANNSLPPVRFTETNVFPYLSQLVQEGRTFGIVILDPPKFARTRSALPEAMRGYRQLMKQGIRLTEPGGFFVFCCCTGLVSVEELIQLLAQTSADERRDLQIVERRGAAPDHPVRASCLESTYLKCLICRVI